jgi:hypothetical protein
MSERAGWRDADVPRGLLSIAADQVAQLFFGSAFLISDRHALTALHVIPTDCRGDEMTLVRLGHVSLRARLVDDEDDLALLEIIGLDREAIDAHERRGIRPAPGLLHPGDTVRVFGFPASRPSEHDVDHVMCTVTGHAQLSGLPTVKLHSPEAAAGKDLHGFSGGPIIAEVDPSGGTRQAVVGIAFWQQPTPEIATGTFYAIPIETALRYWPFLRANEHKLALPSAGVIRRFLSDHLGDGRHPVPFGGRASELEALTTAIRRSTGPSGHVVVAPSGRGKSMLLSQLWRLLVDDDGLEVVFIPIALRYDHVSEDSVLRALAARLAVAKSADPRVAMTASIPQLRENVEELLNGDSASRRRLVVIIDGLDEVSGWDVGPNFLPLHGDVSVVASARSTARRPDGLAWIHALGWDASYADVLALASLDRGGVADVMSSIVPPLAPTELSEAIAGITPLVAGDTLTLSLYARDLQNAEDRGAWLERVLSLTGPPGLDGYLERWWQDQEQLWGGSLVSRGSTVRRVLDILAATYGPVTRAQVLAIARKLQPIIGDELDAALDDLARWVIVTEIDHRYALSHERLAERRRDRLAEDGELAAYDNAVIAWARDTLDAKGLRELADADLTYVGRQLARHLDRGSAPISDWCLLLTPTWLEAADGLSSRPRDLAELAQRLDGANAHAVRQGRAPEHLANRVACAAAQLSQYSASSSLAPELVAQLVRHGVWSDDQGWTSALARRTRSAVHEAVALLAPYLGPESTDAIENVVREDPENFSLLSGLARHLARTHQNSPHLGIPAFDIASIAVNQLLFDIDESVNITVVREFLRYELLYYVTPSIRLDRESPRNAISRRGLAGYCANCSCATAARALGTTPERLLRSLAPWSHAWGRICDEVGDVLERAFAAAAAFDSETQVIAKSRRAKELAISEQDFERASSLRHQEHTALKHLRELEVGVEAAETVRALGYISVPIELGPECSRWVSSVGGAIDVDDVTDEVYSRSGLAARRHILAELIRRGRAADAALLIVDALDEPEELSEIDLSPLDGDAFALLCRTIGELPGGPRSRAYPQVLAALAARGPDQAREALALSRATSAQFSAPAARLVDDQARRVLAAVQGEMVSWTQFRELIECSNDRWMSVEAALCLFPLVREHLEFQMPAVLRAVCAPGRENARLEELLCNFVSRGMVSDADFRAAVNDDVWLAAIAASKPVMEWQQTPHPALSMAASAIAGEMASSEAIELLKYPRLTGAIIERCPEVIRKGILEIALPVPTDWGWRATYAHDQPRSLHLGIRGWADTISLLAPGMDGASLDAALAATTLGGPLKLDGKARAELLVAIVLRFCAVGRFADALQVATQIAEPRSCATAFGALVDSCASGDLPEVAGQASRFLTGPSGTTGRLLVWAHLCSRSSVLTQDTRWTTADAIIRNAVHSDLEDLRADGLCLATLAGDALPADGLEDLLLTGIARGHGG